MFDNLHLCFSNNCLPVYYIFSFHSKFYYFFYFFFISCLYKSFSFVFTHSYCNSVICSISDFHLLYCSFTWSNFNFLLLDVYILIIMPINIINNDGFNLSNCLNPPFILKAPASLFLFIVELTLFFRLFLIFWISFELTFSNYKFSCNFTLGTSSKQS